VTTIFDVMIGANVVVHGWGLRREGHPWNLSPMIGRKLVTERDHGAMEISEDSVGQRYLELFCTAHGRGHVTGCVYVFAVP